MHRVEVASHAPLTWALYLHDAYASVALACDALHSHAADGTLCIAMLQMMPQKIMPCTLLADDVPLPTHPCVPDNGAPLHLCGWGQVAPASFCGWDVVRPSTSWPDQRPLEPPIVTIPSTLLLFFRHEICM